MLTGPDEVPQPALLPLPPLQLRPHVAAPAWPRPHPRHPLPRHVAAAAPAGSCSAQVWALRMRGGGRGGAEWHFRPALEAGPGTGLCGVMATHAVANERLRALEELEREIGASLQSAGGWGLGLCGGGAWCVGGPLGLWGSPAWAGGAEGGRLP